MENGKILGVHILAPAGRSEIFGGHPVETAKTAAAHDYLRARATAEDAGSKCLPETEIAVLPDQPPASLRRHELRSPITGRVAERRVDLGALARAWTSPLSPP